MAPSKSTSKNTAPSKLAAAPTPTASGNGPAECAAALFSYDFGTTGVAYDTLESLHRGEVDEWTDALERSGLFAPAEIAHLDRQWREQPSLLLEILLRDADQVTARRCRLAWASMDRLAPFVVPISHIG